MNKAIMVTIVILPALAGMVHAQEKELGLTLELEYRSKWLSKGVEAYGQQGAFFKTLDIDFYGTGLGLKVTHRNATASGYVDKQRFDYRPYYKSQLFKDTPYAMNYNINAFWMEKPLCFKLEEGRELVEMAREKTVAINYFRRWNASFDRLKREIAENGYGKILKIKTYYTKEVIHNASHGIDLLRYLIGEPVGGKCISPVPPETKDYQADFYLNFDGNVQAFFIGIPDCKYTIFEIDFL